jgi:hypothetical protein
LPTAGAAFLRCLVAGATYARLRASDPVIQGSEEHEPISSPRDALSRASAARKSRRRPVRSSVLKHRQFQASSRAMSPFRKCMSARCCDEWRTSRCGRRNPDDEAPRTLEVRTAHLHIGCAWTLSCMLTLPRAAALSPRRCCTTSFSPSPQTTPPPPPSFAIMSALSSDDFAGELRDAPTTARHAADALLQSCCRRTSRASRAAA